MTSKLYVLLFIFYGVTFIFGQKSTMSADEVKAFTQFVSQESKKIKTLKSEFTQSKKMDFLDRTITTSGSMALKSPQSLAWKYTKPYQYSVVFKDQKILINDKGKKSILDAKSKSFQKLNNLMMGSTNGKLFNDPDFKVSYFKEGKFFIARFVPNNAQMKKYVKEMYLYFEKNESVVHKITMIEASGDETIIQFKNTKINVPIADAEFSL